jgi:hypothetical protein
MTIAIVRTSSSSSSSSPPSSRDRLRAQSFGFAYLLKSEYLHASSSSPADREPLQRDWARDLFADANPEGGPPSHTSSSRARA